MHVDVSQPRQQLGGLVLAASFCFLAVEHGEQRLDRAAVEQAHAVVKVAAEGEEERHGLRPGDGGGVVAGEKDDAVVDDAGFAERCHATVGLGDIAETPQRLGLGIVRGGVDQLLTSV